MITIRTHTKKLFILIPVLALQLLQIASSQADYITQRQLLQQLDSNAPPLIIDVRSEDEFASGHVPGALNIPHTEIAARLSELRDHKHQEVVVYCESGRRAAIAMGVLEQAGFTTVRHLEGDMQSWRKLGLPQERMNPAM